MRCPKCTERNSVAARKCEFCGEKFKRKSLPLGPKLATGGVLLALTASLVASFVVPKLIDPEQNLARVARRFAAGPTSVQDATRAKIEFTDALRAYLKDVGGAKSSAISANLQKLLESTAYEVHIADLPRGIKLVEVDTLLQATDFLVMKTNAGVKVFDLPTFEVFDDARILNDSAGPVLALLGHSGGQPPHHPELCAYALLPDYISDETNKLVPAVLGEGTAKFDKDGQAVRFELSLPSMAKSDNIDLQNGKSDVVRATFVWKDAHYIANNDYSGSSAAVGYMVARAMHHADTIDSRFIGAAVAKYAKANATPPSQTITVSKLASSKKQGISYLLASGNKGCVVVLKKNGTELAAVDVRKATDTEIAKAMPAPDTKNASTQVVSATAPISNAKAITTAAVPTPAAVAATAPARAPVGTKSGAAAAPVAHAPATTPKQLAASLTPAAGGSKRKLVKAAESKIVVRRLHNEEHHEQGAAVAAVAPIAPVLPKAVLPAVPTTVAAKPAQVESRNEKKVHHQAHAVGNGFVSGKNGATLRADATVGSKALTPLAAGAPFEILGEANGWYKVRYGSQEGYVNKELASTGRDGGRRHHHDVASAPATPAPTPVQQTRHHSKDAIASSSTTIEHHRHKRHQDANVEVATAPKHHSKAPVVEQPMLVP